MLPDHVQHIDCLRKITNISILNIIKTLDNVGLLFKKQLWYIVCTEHLLGGWKTDFLV